MYCEKCGNELHAGDKFCDVCGAPIRIQTESTAPSAASAAEKTQVLEHGQTPAEDSAKRPASSRPASTYQTPKSTPSSAPAKQRSAAPIVAAILGAALVCVLAIVAINVVRPAGASDGLFGLTFPWQQESSDKPSESGSAGTGSNDYAGDTDVASSEDSSGYYDSADESVNSLETESANDASDENETTAQQNPKKKKAGKTSGKYILPKSGTKRLTKSDLAGLSDDDLSRAMNEIWARHGRRFKNKWLQRYFDKQSWYKGTIPASRFLKVYKPTKTEDHNAELINDVLLDHGYVLNREHPND